MRLVLISVFSLVMFSFGCAKTEKTTAFEHKTIVGKWMLTDYLMDPGNGRGTWQKADPLNPVHIEFTADGTFIPDDTTRNYNRYELLSDSTIRFTATTSGGHQHVVRFTFTPQKLTLYPPCIEACAYVYKPAAVAE